MADVTPGRFRAASSGCAGIAWLTAGLTAAMFAACGVLLLLTRDYQQAAYGAGGVVAALVCLGVGLVVTRRQPGGPIGWLLLGWAWLIPLVGMALLYSVLDYRNHRGALPFGPVAVILEPAEFLVAALSGLAVLLFPDGRSPTRRWRWVLWVFLAASAAYTARLVAGQVLAVQRHSLRIGPSGAPLFAPVPGRGWAVPGWIAGGLVLACWLLFVGRQVASYRRSTGNRRQQLKWLIGGAACCVLATAVTIFAGNPSSAAAQTVQDAADFGAAALPVGIGVGIVKYHLYDIDRIISRTLAYAIVTGLLAGVYFGLVLLASLVHPWSSPVVVAGSTLVVAALFHPLRRRVQHLVDRRFNRAGYNADQIVTAFAARLQDAVELGAIRGELASVVNAVLEPAHLSVWIKDP
jgi:hypothetical protein